MPFFILVSEPEIAKQLNDQTNSTNSSCTFYNSKTSSNSGNISTGYSHSTSAGANSSCLKKPITFASIAAAAAAAAAGNSGSGSSSPNLLIQPIVCKYQHQSHQHQQQQTSLNLSQNKIEMILNEFKQNIYLLELIYNQVE
jgi:hypothetical protein